MKREINNERKKIFSIIYYIYHKKFGIIRDNNLSEKELIQIKYKEFLAKDVPKLFTEKIQWLNDRRDLYTLCANKYLVRNYIEEKIGSKYLIPLVFMTENYKSK